MSVTSETPSMLSAAPSFRVRSARDIGALPGAGEEEQTSRSAAKGAMQVLKARDSSFKDKLTALRIVLFLTFEDPQSSKFAYWLGIFLFFSIILNCVAFITGSIKTTQVRPDTCARPVCTPGPDSPCTKDVCLPMENPILHQIELWTIVIFTVDYVVRMLCVSVVPGELVFPRSIGFTVDGKIKDRSSRANMGPAQKTLRYLLSWLNIVDVVSILPFYLSLPLHHAALAMDFGVMRVIRLFRVLRVFKLGKYTEGGLIIGRTVRASLPAITLFLFLTAVLTTVFGSIVYFFEGGMFQVTQEFPAGGFLRPNARHTAMEESPFTSILMGIYWVVVNTTTLGNAALFPTTTGGRVASVFVAYLGIFALALPISIVGKNFTEQYNMVYDKVGGQFDAAPHVTSAINHDRELAQRAAEDAMMAAEEAAEAAARVAGLSKTATVVTAKAAKAAKRVDDSLSLSSSSSSSPSPGLGRGEQGQEDGTAALVRELQARLARLEGEVTSLRSQLRDVAPAAVAAAEAVPMPGAGVQGGEQQ